MLPWVYLFYPVLHPHTHTRSLCDRIHLTNGYIYREFYTIKRIHPRDTLITRFIKTWTKAHFKYGGCTARWLITRNTWALYIYYICAAVDWRMPFTHSAPLFIRQVDPRTLNVAKSSNDLRMYLFIHYIYIFICRCTRLFDIEANEMENHKNGLHL